MRENWVEIYDAQNLSIEVNEDKSKFRLTCFKDYLFQEERVLSSRELIDFILEG